MRGSSSFAFSIAVATAAVANPIHAEPGVEMAASVCDGAAREVERRLHEVLAKRGALASDVSVTFEAERADVRVTVATHEQGMARRETALVVSSCEEAAEAAVVVLSLAFSAEADAGPPLRDPEPPRHDTAGAAPAPESPRDEPVLMQPSPKRDETREEARWSRSPDSTRVSFAGGVDVGTLPTSAAFVAGGARYARAALELRGALRYGLPTEHERAETELLERVRRDFGALELGACYGVGDVVRLAACAGGEVGLVRVTRNLERADASVIDEDAVTPRVSGMLAAVFSARTGRIRPELELSGAALAFGRRSGSAPVALRAAAGAAIDF